MGLLDAPGYSRQQADARFADRDVSELIRGRFPQRDSRKLIGPLTGDAPTVVVNAAPSGAYTKAYGISGGAFPVDWPVDMGPAPSYFVGDFNYPGVVTVHGSARPLRLQMDGVRLALNTYVGDVTEGGFLLYVDGAPVSLDLSAFGVGDTFTTIEFATAKPRLIEVMTTAALRAVYTSSPYRLWKPPALTGLRGLLVGDSYSAGVTMDGTDTTQSARLNGFAPLLGLHLGVESWWTEGIGGSGFCKGGVAGGSYVDRLPVHVAAAPDVLAVGGGGANDLFSGDYDVADVVDAATEYFTTARAGLPNAKLIFMEGFAPPNGFGTFNDEYVAIRTALQTALEDVGVYYVDIATSAAWLDGSGWKGNPSGVGNSDVYVGGDGIHPTIPGHRYIRERLGPKLRAIMADDGTLVNTLI